MANLASPTKSTFLKTITKNVTQAITLTTPVAVPNLAQIRLEWDGLVGHWLEIANKHTCRNTDIIQYVVLIGGGIRRMHEVTLRWTQCRINANRGPWWQLFARAPLLTRLWPTTASHSSQHDMLAVISSWYHYGPFLFFCCRSYVKLLDYWRAKKISLLPEAPWSLRPEARGICHICHMVNPALVMNPVSTGMGDHLRAGILSQYITSQPDQLSLASLWGC